MVEGRWGVGGSITASKTYFMSISSYSPQAQANTDKILIDRNLTGGEERGEDVVFVTKSDSELGQLVTARLLQPRMEI